jgi:hypothetical protein
MDLFSQVFEEPIFAAGERDSVAERQRYGGLAQRVLTDKGRVLRR